MNVFCAWHVNVPFQPTVTYLYFREEYSTDYIILWEKLKAE